MKNIKMRRIVLASSSPRRSELLRQVGLRFVIMPSDFVEDMSLKLSPEKLVMELAYGKALSVAKKLKSGIVIGIDTVGACDKKLVGKPRDEKDAYRMLRHLSGRYVDAYSGMCIIDIDKKRTIKDYEYSRIKIKRLTDEEIRHYISTKEPLDKAGAFAIQGMGGIFVERVDGCYSNVIGLPLNHLYKNLKKLGIDISYYGKWKNV
jgi:septum formation protein